ncbi:50S ribosomal protein L32 [Waddlia chondrophila]|uniref:Large ribosomal subunit protein bL32 n=1 Tax=Waddlia chondrophila (strain ATCC VR-1470 / WSU 86-1044) TaxID=716544 RepID=D6YUG5_WADCW|nr:50S ribosomal protein L32 [Waddlia chondrophila]ADI37776.1 50S ribosomal protein L32 [Waddlia chondrophila WSU 86-1044]
MAVPRSRLSNQRKNTRRAHHAKKPRSLIDCSKCGVKRLPHTICQSCGWYGDRSVLGGKEGSQE